jgi:hypothetical protein
MGKRGASSAPASSGAAKRSGKSAAAAAAAAPPSAQAAADDMNLNTDYYARLSTAINTIVNNSNFENIHLADPLPIQHSKDSGYEAHRCLFRVAVVLCFCELCRVMLRRVVANRCHVLLPPCGVMCCYVLSRVVMCCVLSYVSRQRYFHECLASM